MLKSPSLSVWFLAFLWLPFWLTHLALGQNEFSHCQDSSIQSIPVKTKIRGQVFQGSIAYRLVEPLDHDPNLATLIILPGDYLSPGIHHKPAAISDKFRRLEIDFRGSGCSSYPQFLYDKRFGTATLVDDLSKILKKENLENYVLYAQNSSTYMALQLSASAKRRKISPPLAMILESPISQVLDGDLIRRTLNAKLSELWHEAPANVQFQFRTQGKPFGIKKEDWGSWFFFMLKMRNLPRLPERSLADLIGKLDTNDATYLNAFQKTVYNMNLLNESKSSSEMLLSQRLLCQEFMTNASAVPTLLNNEIYWRSRNACKDFSGHNKWIDIKRWKAHPDTTIIYLHGEEDPITSAQHLEQHSQSQNHVLRHHISVKNGGHQPSIFLQDCMEEVLWDILSGFGLSQSSERCSEPLNYQVRLPEK